MTYTVHKTVDVKTVGLNYLWKFV